MESRKGKMKQSFLIEKKILLVKHQEVFFEQEKKIYLNLVTIY